MDNQIPQSWETDRLTIADSVRDELNRLQEIYDDCAYIGEWTGLKSNEENYMLNEFEHKHLPENGKPELHRLQSIKLKDTEEIIGYAVFYHGFPDENTFWVAILAIHRNFQKSKFGQEIIAQLSKEVTRLDYKNIGISVGVKNWPALRFWIEAGFREIIKFDGDKIYTQNTFADLWLKKKL